MGNWLPQLLFIISGVAIGSLISRSWKKKSLAEKTRIDSSSVRNSAKAKRLKKQNKRGR